MSRIIRTLVAAGAAVGISALGLAATAASPAAASTPGTTGVGQWYFDQGDGNNAITTSTLQPAVSYSAQVQQPVNTDGSSIFSAKNRTIPVKYAVTKCTAPGSSDTNYPGVLDSEQGASYPGKGAYGNLSWSPGSPLTVSQISNLSADFTWQTGQNHTGSMYWIINTPDGNVWIYYGDIAGTGVFTGTSGTGANMITLGLGSVRAEASQLGHSPQYDTLANILAATPASGSVTTIGDEPVNWIGLAVDEGSVSTQTVSLTDVTIGTANQGTATYTPGDVITGGGPQTCAASTTGPAWIYVNELSGSTPGPIDETLLDNTQGDSGGQFRVVDGMYMYNFPVSNLPDKTATYQFGIMVGSSTATPAGVVRFGLR